MKQKIKIVKFLKVLENGAESHLYATVSQDVEPIKEGDWHIVFNVDEKEIDIRNTNKFLSTLDKKIIATTDPKLRVKTSRNEKIVNPGVYEKPLPQVSQSFIEEYIDNPDGEYEVEYLRGSDGHYDDKDVWHWKMLGLKLNQDNTVNITLVKEKMHSDEKVKNLLMTALFEPSPYNVDEAMNWIKENL